MAGERYFLSGGEDPDLRNGRQFGGRKNEDRLRKVHFSGNLLQFVIAQTGRFRHDEDAIASTSADTLFYEFATRAGYQMAKSRANVRYQPRLLANLETSDAK